VFAAASAGCGPRRSSPSARPGAEIRTPDRNNRRPLFSAVVA
jgi:hypothetical protein